LKTLAYYISAHGYGHGVRSADILRALARRLPDWRFILVSDLPAAFLRLRLAGVPHELRAAAFDVGMVQLDSIRVDVPATLARVEQLLRERQARVASETRWLREAGVGAVVADIPAMPLEAAAALELPRLAIGNFAWDWIYEAFGAQDPRWLTAVDAFRRGYACAELLLRLPFAPEMTAFPRSVDIPLLADPGRARREDLAGLTGADPRRPWILLSFTTLEWSETVLDRVERELADYEFFTVRPLEWRRRNIHPVAREQIPFSDVLASSDGVLTKPGYGIISECIVNDKVLIYADRADFREYSVLVEGIRRYCRNVHIPAAQLYAGDLAESLAAARRAPPPPERMAAGGAERAAEIIAAQAQR